MDKVKPTTCRVRSLLVAADGRVVLPATESRVAIIIACNTETGPVGALTANLTVESGIAIVASGNTILSESDIGTAIRETITILNPDAATAQVVCVTEIMCTCPLER